MGPLPAFLWNCVGMKEMGQIFRKSRHCWSLHCTLPMPTTEGADSALHCVCLNSEDLRVIFFLMSLDINF